MIRHQRVTISTLTFVRVFDVDTLLTANSDLFALVFVYDIIQQQTAFCTGKTQLHNANLKSPVHTSNNVKATFHFDKATFEICCRKWQHC